MYIVAFLFAVMNLTHCQVLIAERRSALIEQLLPLQNATSSPERMIVCAFRMMKHNYVGARMSPGTDRCDKLHGSQLVASKLEHGYEYLKTATVFMYPKEENFTQEIVRHNLFSAVAVGDMFRFVIEKTSFGGFSIGFKQQGYLYVLLFEDFADTLELNDGGKGMWGEAENPTYPFAESKEYKIEFKVLETHWQIYIDGAEFTTFEHRQPVSKIKRIQVISGGNHVTYRSKSSNPKIT